MVMFPQLTLVHEQIVNGYSTVIYMCICVIVKKAKVMKEKKYSYDNSTWRNVITITVTVLFSGFFQ